MLRGQFDHISSEAQRLKHRQNIIRDTPLSEGVGETDLFLESEVI